uniref:FAS1 domain-containing protein n=1 Tax=Noccaea caerulescens TaxID=107243 RepID=A0A1J3I8R3_NOCCA
MKKHQFLKNPVFFLFLLITASSLIILIFSFLRLPETPQNAGDHLFLRDISDEIGFFGKMMIEMLPEDLVFTAFVPSDKAFSRDLRLKLNSTHPKNPHGDDGDNTYAVVSRIMSFSVVPYKVEERDIGNDETASYESLSGFTVKIWKKRNGGGLVVNGVETEKIGLKRGKIIVHTIDGVLMDSDFAQSVASSEDEP